MIKLESVTKVYKGEVLALHEASCDIQKGEFVSTFYFVGRSDFDRVASVAEIDKIHPLDHAAIFNIQAGYDAFSQHEERLAPL